MRSALLGIWDRICALPVLVQDGWLYLLSGAFAGATAVYAVSSDYREWGQVAGCTYVAAAVICFAAVLVERRRAERGAANGAEADASANPVKRIGRVRRVAVLTALCGAVLAPLMTQLVWRAEGLPGQHAQPEVAVVERAADRAAHLQDPYLLHPTSVGISPQTDGHNVNAGSFYPYLPGMIPFGYLNALDLPPELQDARVALVGFTLLIAAVALMSSDATVHRRGRVLQFLVCLPSGALALVTGGDDLPVLALMLLGLVFAQQRRPVLAGVVIGLGATLKFTAWPLLVLMLFAARDREDRPAPLRYGLSVAVVSLPIVAIGVLAGPRAFLENVVKFPLGLTALKSPAASPLLGQYLVNVLPSEKLVLTALLLLVGLLVVVAGFLRYRPRTPADVARFTAFAMTVATVLAPATRFGYLIYPLNFVVFAYLLDGMAAMSWPQRAQSASSISKIVRETVLVGTVSLPPSAGVMDDPSGFTSTPTSQ